ncbi:Structural Maintenance Of Chromosomes Protein 2 [Manis pentadactyla]|nr:Structural Maintenance Of Chromosomes Protein 2 [Manis pentadactyla]
MPLTLGSWDHLLSPGADGLTLEPWDCASRGNYPAEQTDGTTEDRSNGENAQLIKEEACDTMGYYASILGKGKVCCGMSSRRDSEEMAAEKQHIRSGLAMGEDGHAALGGLGDGDVDCASGSTVYTPNATNTRLDVLIV